MRRPFSRPAFLLVLLAAFACSCGAVQAKTVKPKKSPKSMDLTDTVLSNRILTKFALLLRASNLGSFLSSRGPFTLFAPTDSAFSRIPPDVFAALQAPENEEAAQRIILFHIVNGRGFTVSDLKTLKTLPSCEGHPLALRVNHIGYQIVGRAKILHGDMRTMNGLMHEIDTVLIPPDVSLSKLAAPPAPVPVVNTVENPVAPTNAPDSATANPIGPIDVAPGTNAAPVVTPVQ